jgi:flagellar hook-associated protein 3 FlgL
MTIRVTVGSASAGALAGLQAASARYADLQQQLSTGNQISKPSDDPAGTVRALELRGDLKRNAQYARSQADATGWLSVADTAYGQITDLVQKVRTLTVQASNTGASTGASATAIANEISSIRDAIVKLANTSYNGQPVFGGTTIYGQPGGPTGPFELSDPADPSSAIVYKGDSGTINRTIGDQNKVQINQTGTDAFGTDATGASGLFALLDELAANLTTGGSPAGGSVTDPLGQVDDAINKLTSARAQSGAALARVEAAQTTAATDKISIKTNLSQIQDIDLAEVAIAMNTAQVVYQASLQTTANIRQLSLLNYLK